MLARQSSIGRQASCPQRMELCSQTTKSHFIRAHYREREAGPATGNAWNRTQQACNSMSRGGCAQVIHTRDCEDVDMEWLCRTPSPDDDTSCGTNSASPLAALSASRSPADGSAGRIHGRFLTRVSKQPGGTLSRKTSIAATPGPAGTSRTVVRSGADHSQSASKWMVPRLITPLMLMPAAPGCSARRSAAAPQLMSADVQVALMCRGTRSACKAHALLAGHKRAAAQSRQRANFVTTPAAPTPASAEDTNRAAGVCLAG